VQNGAQMMPAPDAEKENRIILGKVTFAWASHLSRMVKTC
jgi:hypothetical protein